MVAPFPYDVESDAFKQWLDWAAAMMRANRSGWARYVDALHDESDPIPFSADTEFQITFNAGAGSEVDFLCGKIYYDFDLQEIVTQTEGRCVLFTLNAAIDPNSNGVYHAQTWLDINGQRTRQVTTAMRTTAAQPIHYLDYTTMLTLTGDFAADGAKIKMEVDTNGVLHGIVATFACLYNPPPNIPQLFQ